MATTLAAFGRRGSLLETWRLFVNGAGRVWLLVLIVLGGPALMLFFMPHHQRAIGFLQFSLLMVFGLAFATWHFEDEMGERLAFMTTLAQPIDTRRLVLVPMCALAFATTAAVAVQGRMPLTVALAALGTAWWTIASTRWHLTLRFWPLYAVPLLAGEPAGVYAIHRLGGWGLAATVSMVLGIGALMLQPRAYVGEPLKRRQERGRPQLGTSARVAGQAISGRVGASGSWLASAGRFSQLTFGGHWWSLPAVLLLVAGIGLMFPIQGYRMNLFLWLSVIPGRALARAYSGKEQEFIRTRPFGGKEHFVGGALPHLMLLLLAPATALCFLTLDWINHGGLLGLLMHLDGPHSEDVRYMREALGAVFLPEKWPAGGLTGDLWVRLRPLLCLDLLRTALLMLAMAFAIPIDKGGEKLGGRSIALTNVVMGLAVLGAMIRMTFFFAFKSVPMPPLWFAAVLAAATVANWVSQAHGVGAPSRPRRAATGSSTRG